MAKLLTDSLTSLEQLNFSFWLGSILGQSRFSLRFCICLQQPMYEPSALNRQQYSTTSYQKSSYTSYTTQGATGIPAGQFTPPPMNPPPPVKPMTPLSNNLSELDMLLQDLSSAQFMAEVDRRNQGNWQIKRHFLSTCLGLWFFAS